MAAHRKIGRLERDWDLHGALDRLAVADAGLQQKLWAESDRRHPEPSSGWLLAEHGAIGQRTLKSDPAFDDRAAADALNPGGAGPDRQHVLAIGTLQPSGPNIELLRLIGGLLPS